MDDQSITGTVAEAKPCPVCQNAIQPGAPAVACPACGVPHHTECWKGNQGCSTAGCTVRIGASQPTQHAAQPLTQRAAAPQPPPPIAPASCPRCGFQLGPFDKECPRCARLGPANAVPQGPYQPRPGAGPYGRPQQPATPYFDPAGFWIRVAAAMIDGILFGVLFLFVAWPKMASMISMMQSTAGARPTPAQMQAMNQAMAAMQANNMFLSLIFLVYDVTLTTLVGGTLGKLALGLRIVKVDGERVGFGTALGRYFVKGILGAITLNIMYIVLAFNDEKRGWHDQIMSTRVIHNR